LIYLVAMCDCHQLGLSPNHEQNACPVTASLYCSLCQIHGHPTMKCPDRVEWHYRKPEFIEQLIPQSILSHYNINTMTPITSLIKQHPPYIHGEPVIEIPFDEDGKNIRATLASHNLPSSSVKKNKELIEKYGTLVGKKVEHTNPSKRSIKTK